MLGALGAIVPANTVRSWTPAEGGALIGRPAPEWDEVEWIQGGPLTLAGLRAAGKVVLLRFWLVDCPLCRRTAPALRELDARYRDRGLAVVGIHHPKSERAKARGVVESAVAAYGFRFPVAMDNTWKTVRAYGVGSIFESYTSVTFLIDRTGVIRFVHDGGEFHRGGGDEHAQCHRAYQALVAAIESQLGATETSGSRGSAEN